MIKIPYIFSIFFVSIILFSCKTKKDLKPEKNKISTTNNSSITLDSVSANLLDFKTLSFRSKTDIDSEKLNAGFSIQFRIKKDEIIWASVTALGAIEVARAFITPDSIKILDRINGKYIAQDFSYLSQVVKTDIDFNTLQAVLVGNTPAQVLTAGNLKVVNDDKLNLLATNNNFTFKSGYNSTFNLLSLLANNSEATQNLTIDYSEITNVNGQKFPQLVKGKSINKDETINFELSYSRITINEELQFPFTIPQNLRDK